MGGNRGRRYVSLEALPNSNSATCGPARAALEVDTAGVANAGVPYDGNTLPERVLVAVVVQVLGCRPAFGSKYSARAF